MATAPAPPSAELDTGSLIAATARGQEDDLAAQLIHRARTAHQNANCAAPADEGYLLGERNAYAEAAGLAMAHGADALTYLIANRITDDLADGITDVDELCSRARTAAQVEQTQAGERTHGVEWIGPLAFTRRCADRGLDEDFGTSWGPRHEQRISHRHQPGADDGVLYAYDPTWAEYAVLAEHASLRAVRDEYAHALGANPHLPVAAFADHVAHLADRDTPQAEL